MEKKYKKLNIFYLPAILIMILFVVYPLGNAIYLSFFRWNGYSTMKEYIQFENYTTLFYDKDFWTAFRNTLLFGFGSMILQQVIGLSLALFLNLKFKGRTVVRTVIYMPVMVSPLIMGYIMYFFFQTKGGVFNDILIAMGFPPIEWLANSSYAIAALIFVNVFQYVGVSMVIYLAGIQGISQSYLEAADIDGANHWKKFRYITLPLLIPALASSVIYNLIGGLKLYDVIVALTGGGPAKSTHSFATFIADRYFNAERAGYAASIGVISFLVIMFISILVNKYFREKEKEVVTS